MKKNILIIAIILMAVSGIMLVREVLKYQHSAELAEEAKEQLRYKHETEMETETEAETEAKTETVSETESEIETIAEELPHMRENIMWLNFPSTDEKVLDYPVMCDNKDDYYFLDHSAVEDGMDEDGAKTYIPDTAGAVFTRSDDFANHQGDIVVFAHSMKNGSMLKDVRKFDQRGNMYDAKLVEQYANGEKYITLDVYGEDTLKLTPFYCYHGEADNSFMWKHEGEQLRQFILEKTGTDIGDDTIVLFITCSYNESKNERTYLFCKEAS